MRVTSGLCVFVVLVVLAASPAGAQVFWEMGNCTGASATVGISTASYSCKLDTVSASGTWSAANAAGIHLDYYLDGVLYQSEYRAGSSGTWSFIEAVTLFEGVHTLRVDGFPVVSSGGVDTTCWQQGATASQGFSVNCLPDASIGVCSWNCDDLKHLCSGTCPGSVSGGTPLFLYTWGVGDPNGFVSWGSTTGPTPKRFNNSPTLSCRDGYAGVYDKILFKVQDSEGHTDTAIVRCGVNLL